MHLLISATLPEFFAREMWLCKLRWLEEWHEWELHFQVSKSPTTTKILVSL